MIIYYCDENVSDKNVLREWYEVYASSLWTLLYYVRLHFAILYTFPGWVRRINIKDYLCPVEADTWTELSKNLKLMKNKRTIFEQYQIRRLSSTKSLFDINFIWISTLTSSDIEATQSCVFINNALKSYISYYAEHQLLSGSTL